MSSIRLTDRQWAFIRPYLPAPARTGRPRADDRCTIEGILYVLITGCRWQDLPRVYGAPLHYGGASNAGARKACVSVSGVLPWGRSISAASSTGLWRSSTAHLFP